MTSRFVYASETRLTPHVGLVAALTPEVFATCEGPRWHHRPTASSNPKGRRALAICSQQHTKVSAASAQKRPDVIDLRFAAHFDCDPFEPRGNEHEIEAMRAREAA